MEATGPSTAQAVARVAESTGGLPVDDLGHSTGKSHHMNMDHSAWEGFEIDGHVDTVISKGKVIVDAGQYLGRKGDGSFVKRGLSQYLV